MIITKRRKHSVLAISVFWILMIFTACSEPRGIYIDIKKGAIISCDGKGIGEILIENDSVGFTLHTYESVVYFNKKTNGIVEQSYKYGDIVTDFDFKLKSKCIYKITKRMGYDRGPFTITFKTDSLGRAVTASDTVCR